MRSIPFLIGAAILSSCVAAPPGPVRTADDQRRLDELLVGKVPQGEVSCLPSYNSNDMRVIDENTIAFRVGSSQTYVAHTTGCSNLRPGGPYALLTHQFGGMGMCRGDIAQVVDTTNGINVGSCAITGFTHFVRPGR